MANSPLDYPSSELFRNRLIVRNLVPYAKSPRRVQPPITYPIIQSDYAVIDSPDNLIDEPTFANGLYPLNQYGAEGGYKQVPDPTGLNNTNSNEGEYGYQDANLIDRGISEVRSWRPLNPYGDGINVVDSAIDFWSLNTITTNFSGQFNAQPYPTTFVYSFYSPVNILLSSNPRGNNGNLSQDSFIARLGAQILRKEFEERIAREIRQRTIDRANLFNVNSGTDVLDLLTGRIPLIEPNYQITVPSNPIVGGTDLALRLAGTLVPISLIPGSYFDASINSRRPATTAQLQSAYGTTGGFLSTLLGPPKSGSQLFLNNTGGGQKSRLFGTLDYNKFKPDYDRTFFDRLAGALVPGTSNNSEYYVGSRNSEPSRVFSPSGELPINELNKEVQSPVYGPNELAQLYEGPTSKDIKLGANGPIYSNGGSIEGGMTWVSPKYKDNAGIKVGPGGENVVEDPDFKEFTFGPSESTRLTLKQGSILDETQRLINSQPNGARRFQHAGNAIDQVSKVFHDGYRELTKGSRVLAYVGDIGQEKGAEYCRVFAKDTPYLQYNDLQKTNGMTTEGRRFSFSVLDKTYNLNMYPNKREGGQDSTNLVMGGVNGEYAKKYMFSIENLAWRTSNRPGYTVADLPVCERGPNGGRVMWFPPYDLKFSESSSANFKGTDFIGRPEPVYTYNNTNRTGSLSWKIVVDHPSVLNLVVNKVLANETNKVRVDSILESFFAGCRKYDLYELAKKYYTVNPNDIFEIQKELQYRDVSVERIRYIKKTVQTGEAGQPEIKSPGPQVTVEDLNSTYSNISAYFENDYPKKNVAVPNYSSLYPSYIGQKTVYNQRGGEVTTQFFDATIIPNYNRLNELVSKIVEVFTKYDENKQGVITITIDSSTSAPATQAYNLGLSKRRIESLSTFFKENPALTTFIGNGKLIINGGTAFGETTTATVTNGGQNIGSQTFDCGGNGDRNPPDKEIYTINAMACRRAFISRITMSGFLAPKSDDIITQAYKPSTIKNEEFDVPENYNETVTVSDEVTRTVIRDNITKRVLRSLLTECDYFETIKEETPMVYDSLKEKLKFFNPAFHSTTPEGLNSRLTFLQQCLRPGDTIPVTQKDGTLKYNDAINTSFGAPPVLILRVGDFFHSKIIPDSLQLSYENLDLNPEGIGIQPMIATVQFSFKFVGGQGLAGAVDKLQNALTFNYYANTEMYDDRADVTDESYKVLDKEFLDYFNIQVPPPTINQGEVPQSSKNNETVGTILSATTTSSGETGTLNYQLYMNGFIESIQQYFVNVINKNKEVNKQYNNGVRQNWSNLRNYITGNFQHDTTKTVRLFGKPKNIEQVFQTVTNDFITDINNETEGFIQFIKGTPGSPKNYSDKVKRTLKENYVKYINSKKTSYQSALSVITQDFLRIQQNLINNIAKNNLITYGTINTSGTDGYRQKNGFITSYETFPTIKVYKPTSTNTLEELYTDTNTIINDLIDYYDEVTKSFTFKPSTGVDEYQGFVVHNDNINDGKLFNPFSINPSFEEETFKRSYFLLSQEVTDETKYNTFKQALIGNIISNPTLFPNSSLELDKEFDGYWKNEVRPIFTEENNLTTFFLDTFEKQQIKYTKYTPFDGAGLKKYEFTFETDTSAISTTRKFYVEVLGYSENKFKTTTSWSDDNQNPTAVVCKVKLG
jgi:hypothetical protein